MYICIYLNIYIYAYLYICMYISLIPVYAYIIRRHIHIRKNVFVHILHNRLLAKHVC